MTLEKIIILVIAFIPTYLLIKIKGGFLKKLLLYIISFFVVAGLYGYLVTPLPQRKEMYLLGTITIIICLTVIYFIFLGFKKLFDLINRKN